MSLKDAMHIFFLQNSKASLLLIALERVVLYLEIYFGVIMLNNWITDNFGKPCSHVDQNIIWLLVGVFGA